MRRVRSGDPRRLLQHAQKDPVLGLGDRPTLRHLDGVPDPGDVVLIVHLLHGPPPDVFAVLAVLDRVVDRDLPRLVARVGLDDAHLPGGTIGNLDYLRFRHG